MARRAAKETQAVAPSPALAPPLLKLSEAASAQAPFVYFEDATAFGHMNGIVRVTLEAIRTMATEQGSVHNERVVTAHLRMNIPAARSLMSALQGALLLATTAESKARN